MSQTETYAIDTAELGHLLRQVAGSAVPDDSLYGIIRDLAADLQFEMQAALFESINARAPVRHFGTLYLMTRCYHALGRRDACYAAAVTAISLKPDSDRSETLKQIVSTILTERNCYVPDDLGQPATSKGSIEPEPPERVLIDLQTPLVNVALGKPGVSSSDAGHRDQGKPPGSGATSGVRTGARAVCVSKTYRDCSLRYF